MKQIKIIILLMLVLSLVLGTFTSCDLIDTILGNNDDGGDKVACEHAFENGKCLFCGEDEPKEEENENNGNGNNNTEVSKKEAWLAQYETITIAEALTKCEEFVSSPSADRFYIIATVKSVDDTAYGKLMIEDETGEIMVYGTNSADGSLKYDKMGVDLKAGDLILIYGTLQNYKGTTKEVQNAWLIDYEGGEVVVPEYTPDTNITIEEAIALAPYVTLNDRFYITATVKNVSNSNYGAMYLVDENGNEISVYGTYNSDGTVQYPNMEDKPLKGDTVTVYANLQVFNSKPEIQSAWVISVTHFELDQSKYTEMTVAEAREAAEGTLIKTSGVVASITYANGYIPAGFYLVDSTGSIYVYDRDAAGNVKVGNTVTVAGAKDFWILDTETNSASKFGYKGCNQLADAYVLENDNGTSDFNKSWITESTVKEIMDTPVSENITTTIFKVTALVKRVDGNGFINYYIDDIDGHTGSYVYTQCNGGDFAWLDEFDGKFCTVYLSAINAKSSTSGCVWRFLPVAVIDEGYTFDVNEAPKYAVTYHGLTQFLASYTGDPAIVLETLVSSELLGFEGATLTYTSSDENVVYFTNENGVITFHGKDAGTATITVSASHGNNTYSKTMEITIKENIAIDSITVADAIATPFDTDVVVKGIVGPSLVNRDGFYLFGEDGSMIAVLITKDQFEGLAIGHEIVVSGMRERFIKDDTYTTYGQDAIVNGQILANYYGNHKYSTEKFITDKTLADIKALPVTESHSTEVYIVKAKVEFIETAYYTTLKITYNGTELPLYCSGAGQYSWLKAYAGQEITIEIAPCNWNDKQDNYRGCVLAVVLEDGSKIYNTLNFGN